MHRKWSIKLTTVNYNGHPIGSILEVGKDISEEGAIYILRCNAAITLDNQKKQVIIDKPKRRRNSRKPAAPIGSEKENK